MSRKLYWPTRPSWKSPLSDHTFCTTTNEVHSNILLTVILCSVWHSLKHTCTQRCWMREYREKRRRNYRTLFLVVNESTYTRAPWRCLKLKQEKNALIKSCVQRRGITSFLHPSILKFCQSVWQRSCWHGYTTLPHTHALHTHKHYTHRNTTHTHYTHMHYTHTQILHTHPRDTRTTHTLSNIKHTHTHYTHTHYTHTL
jgi:hypothetical protein